MITVRELMKILLSAEDLDAYVYVDNRDESNPQRIAAVEQNLYSWGFIIGKAVDH